MTKRVNIPEIGAINFPDEMSLEEINAEIDKLQQARWKYKADMAGQGPSPNLAGALESTYYGGIHALGNALNFALGTPQSGFSDEWLRGVHEETRPYKKAHPLAFTLGGLGASLALPNPVSKIKAVGFLPRLGKAMLQSGPGALEGALFSDPSERERNAKIGAVAGPVVGAIAEPLSAMASRADSWANRSAAKYFNPSETAKEEIIDVFTRPGDVSSHAPFERFGKLAREKGQLDIWKTAATKFDLIKSENKQLAEELASALNELDAIGATANRDNVINTIAMVRDKFFNKPGSSNLKSSISGRRMMNELLHDIATDPKLATGNPLGNTIELKRKLQEQGFLTSASKYVSGKAVAADPEAKALRGAARAARLETERAAQAADPELGAEFVGLNKQYHEQDLVEELSRARAMSKYSGARSPGEGSYNPRSALWRMGADPLWNVARPLTVKGLGLMSRMPRTEDPIRKMLIESLRNREPDNAP